MKRFFTLIFFVLCFSLSYGQGTETFVNMCTSSCSPASSSYGTRSFSGAVGGTSVNATDARTDQTITSNAICFRNGSVVISGISGGVGTVCFDYQRAFTTGAGTVGLFSGGTQYGTDVTVTSTLQNTCIDINLSTATEIEIARTSQTSGTLRTIVDNIVWTDFSLPQPVSLTSFTAQTEKNNVTLNWETESEINNDYFSVEHSSNGKEFKEIGKVLGAGWSTSTESYDFSHQFLRPGFHYYRLRQVDFDGRFEYSEVISVEIFSNGLEFLVYPTNTSNSITVEIPENTSGEATLEIFTSTGHQVYTQTISGKGMLTIDVSDLDPGTYFVRISDGNQYSTSRFFRF